MNPKLNYLQPDWPAPATVHAATTFRTGGMSIGHYQSLNLATHVDDEVNYVQQNRERIKQLLRLPSEPVWLEQTHSNLVINAAAVATMNPVADASYSSVPGIVCAVLTADCLPILVCSEEGDRVAAIHAGWKGLLAGIISNTLAHFTGKNVLVWLGPAIGVECFQVGSEVRTAFMAKSSEYSEAFQARGDKWLADIYALARIELNSLGITQIYGGQLCTVCDKDNFYSYRREIQTGRMATLIWRDS